MSELRPRPITTPAAGNAYSGELPNLPKDGEPPMRQDRVYMTDTTRKSLEAVGWKDGDPIPGDLGEQLQAIRNSLLQEAASASLQDSELAVGWTPPKANYVDIRDLPKAQQDEVRQLLIDYKAQVAEETQRAQQLTDINKQIPPTIQGEERAKLVEQMQQAVVARNMRGEGLGVVIDDRKQPEQSQAAPAAPVSPAASPATPVPQSVGTAIPAATTDLPDAGTSTLHLNCQRCQWPLSAPFEIKPTTVDKEHFIAAILGQNVFVKKYTKLKGQMVITCRSLTVADTQMIQQQMGAMVRSADIVKDAEYIATMHEFRMVLTVQSIMIGTNLIYQMNGIEKWVDQNPPTAEDQIDATPLPRLVQYFYKHGVPTEISRRIVGNTCSDFQRLVEMLEVMVDQPDFW